mmetsp:Transcript_113442/g.315895  ORF Transcript_113442/g.315895 Transcript_113442/m.315895 type:complete len:269 (-) Transcript_113442:170-976(-)
MACATASNSAGAEAIFGENILHSQAQLDDAHSCDTLIEAAVQEGDTARAEELLATMRENGVFPSAVGFARLLHALAQAGEVEHAEQCFYRMRAAGIPANAAKYNELLLACAQARDHRRAERWLERMLEVRVPPDSPCYSNVILACARAGLADRAEMWLLRLTDEAGRSAGLVPERHNYTDIAQVYATEGEYSDIERLFAEMEDQGIAMDESNVSLLLAAYSLATPRPSQRAETALRKLTARGLQVTEPQLAMLRDIIGDQRLEELLAE